MLFPTFIAGCLFLDEGSPCAHRVFLPSQKKHLGRGLFEVKIALSRETPSSCGNFSTRK